MKLFSTVSAGIRTPARMEAKADISAQETPTTAVELNNPWQTVLFNDEVHSFDQVILQIQKATGYSLERAVEITLRVHNKGKAIVTIGSKIQCEKVAGILGQIQLTTSIEKT